MLHLEIGIQIKQGWQFLHYCENAIEKKLFFHLPIPFFPHVQHVYSHSKMFSKKFLAYPLREAFQKKWIFYDNLSKGGQVANSKHDFFPKRNYDKRVGARIISQKIKTMNSSLFIEKTTPNPQLLHLYLYFCTCHQSITFLCVSF